ncbi:TPR repeat-containing protein [Diplonema papillatum]|nr:TPR repeat-containing protein [Diplonema papillatum]|eukprot:gene6408-9806_t
MPPKGPSAKEKKKAQKALEMAAKESMEAVAEGEAILDKINVDKNTGLGQFPKAIAQFTRAIEANPSNATAFLMRAKCMKLTLEFEKAIADYTMAIELNNQDTEALASRGYCSEQVRDWDAAIADYSAIIELQPDDDHPYNMRGLARAKKRPAGLNLKNVEYMQVIADFTKAIELNDCNYYAYASRANARFDRREYFSAIEDYSRALHIKDDYWYVLSRRGLAYYEYVLAKRTKGPASPEEEEEREKLAAENRRKPLEQQWEDEFWQEERELRDKEQVEAFLTQAVADFTNYIKHDEKDKGDPDPATLVHRAHTYLLQDNLDDALKDFKKAKQLDPSLDALIDAQITDIRNRTGVAKAING